MKGYMNFDDVKWYANRMPAEYKYTLCKMYGKDYVIVPRLSVCSEYYIPVTSQEATEAYKSICHRNIKLPSNITAAIHTNVTTTTYAATMRDQFKDKLKASTKKGSLHKCLELVNGSIGYKVFHNEISKYI